MIIHRTPDERSKHYQSRMALWVIGLLAVNSAYYYFGEPSFLAFLPLYVFTIFGMLATFLTELLEILIAEIREIGSPQSPNKQ